MQDFLRNLQDLNWWLGIVVVGLVINLSSAYLKPNLDNIWGKLSMKRKLLNGNKKREIDKKVTLLLNDQSGQDVFRLEIDVIQYMIRFFACLILSLLVMVIIIIGSKILQFDIISLLIFSGIVVILLVMSFLSRTTANQIEMLLGEYYYQRHILDRNP